MARSVKKAKKITRKAARKEPARRKRPPIQGYGSEPGFPISLAMRAGDYVFTSAQGDHEFDPALVKYDARGLVVSDGNTLPPRTVGDETRSALRNLEKALKLAGCTLEDVVDASVWLRDPRDFHEMNKAYGEFFKKNQPTRSIFRIDFMFDCRVEIKVTAYKPR
ncbi:MAG TPA: RidA family protein [Candidatus Binatia bacterium]|nr:RidA family protein [Candidatus Binatia bacterium]